MQITPRGTKTKKDGKVRVLLISYPDKKSTAFTVTGTTLKQVNTVVRAAINSVK